ncbi:MAG: acetate/propionate family kinase [Rhodospirillales bacterium]
MPDNCQILVLNAGSSSLKFALYAPDGGIVSRDQIEGIGRGGNVADHAAALDRVFSKLADAGDIAAVGHRVVHGGGVFAAPEVVTPALLATLETFEPLAPHHQPHNLTAIRTVDAARPGILQVACFDTAFHADMPAEARETGLPRAYGNAGIRRYGFHGLSYEYIVGALPRISGEPLPERLIVAHLGNGASMAAVKGGRGVATTMGFSTADGIPMATRSGAVDPGALIEVMRRDGLDAAGIEDVLYNRAGLLGLSGVSADMRTLLASEDPAAAAAVSFFCYRIAREIGSLAAATGGLDALVFTGGVGANAAPVRADVCRRSAWLGVEMSPDRNHSGGPVISTDASGVAVYAMATDEESVIADHTRALADGSPG